MMHLQHFWWIGALFSLLYTAGSIWWTIRAERMLRRINAELRVLDLAHRYTARDLESVNEYVSKARTLS